MPINYSAPDLTQHPPRSPRVRLGGYSLLPRSIDKARAKAAGKIGEYGFPNPMDKRLFAFAGIDAEAFAAFVSEGKSDLEILTWFNTHSSVKPTEWQIVSWSTWLENLSPGDAKRHGVFSEQLAQHAPGREDIRTFMDRLDFDDYLTFGGRV